MKRTAAILTKYPLLILLLFVLVAYLPVFLPFFHIKNDLVTQNLPTRFVISESLYSGYFPWWNPYINFGIPQYGDMNDGFWNPCLWLIARTSGYSIWAITLEEMFYILAGGWGICLLCREQYASKATAVITGISYMSCGYILGHLQHFCWITGTAFFPYVLLYFIRIHRSPRLKNFIIGGLCVFLFVASTHPGLVIGALYFLGFASIIIWLLRKDGIPGLYSPRYWLINLGFLVISGLFSIVVIVSNLDVVRHISRGTRVSLEQSLLNPTTFPSYLSLLFPLAVQKSDFFNTDIAMRNTYIGVFLLICFILFCIRANRRLVTATVAVLLFFILLASGGLFKTFAYHFLPYTDHVRLNGEFTYFVLLILLLAGACGLEHYFTGSTPTLIGPGPNPTFDPAITGPVPTPNLASPEPTATGPANPGSALTSTAPNVPNSGLANLTDRSYTVVGKRLTQIFQWLFALATILAAGIILFIRNSILFAGHPPAGDGREHIKWIIDQLTFWDLFFLQSLVQWITSYILPRHPSRKPRLTLVIAANLVIICWAVLPYTGLGMASKANRQALISTFPKGIHAPEQKSLATTLFIDSSHTRDLILLGSYSKKIGYPKEEQYPVELSTTESFFNDPALFQFIRQQSYIFLSTDTTIQTATRYDTAAIHIGAFGPGHLEAVVNNRGYHYLTFLQNNYPYWHVRVNGRQVPAITGFGTFITIPIPEGVRSVEFIFDPAPIKKALLISLILITAGLLIIAYPYFMRYILP